MTPKDIQEIFKEKERHGPMDPYIITLFTKMYARQFYFSTNLSSTYLVAEKVKHRRDKPGCT